MVISIAMSVYQRVSSGKPTVCDIENGPMAIEIVDLPMEKWWIFPYSLPEGNTFHSPETR